MPPNEDKHKQISTLSRHGQSSQSHWKQDEKRFIPQGLISSSATRGNTSLGGPGSNRDREPETGRHLLTLAKAVTIILVFSLSVV